MYATYNAINAMAAKPSWGGIATQNATSAESGVPLYPSWSCVVQGYKPRSSAPVVLSDTTTTLTARKDEHVLAFSTAARSEQEVLATEKSSTMKKGSPSSIRTGGKMKISNNFVMTRCARKVTEYKEPSTTSSKKDKVPSTASAKRVRRRHRCKEAKKAKQEERKMVFLHLDELAKQEWGGMGLVTLRGGGDGRKRKGELLDTDDEASSDSSSSSILYKNPFSNTSTAVPSQSTSTNRHTPLFADSDEDDGGGKLPPSEQQDDFNNNSGNDSDNDSGNDSNGIGGDQLSYTFKQPQYQIDVTSPLCNIGTIGRPGYHFPTSLFFSKKLITDEGFDGLPKAGYYGYLLRGNGDLYMHYTYAKLQRIDDSNTFYFMIDPNSDKTKSIPLQYIHSHFLRAFEVNTNDFGGQIVLTQSSANAISSNSVTATTSTATTLTNNAAGSFVLDIGPVKPKIYHINKTGKHKGRSKTKDVCQVRTCDKHGLWKSTMGNSNKLYLCKMHRSMHNRAGPCIDYNDVTDNDLLENKKNNGSKIYHEIINEYLNDWRNDESVHGDQRIKINIISKIVDAFQTRSSSGRFLFYIGRGTDKQIYEYSEIELYDKISNRMLRSIASDEITPNDRTIPESEFLKVAAICKRKVVIGAEEDNDNDARFYKLDENDTIGHYLLQHNEITDLECIDKLTADENSLLNRKIQSNDGSGKSRASHIYEYKKEGSEYMFHQSHLDELNNADSADHVRIYDLPTHVRLLQFTYQKRVYRTFIYTSEGKLHHFNNYAFPYDGSRVLKIDPINMKIERLKQLRCNGGYPSVFRAKSDFYISVHRAVLLLYGGPNNSTYTFSPGLVGDHKEGNKMNYAVKDLQWLLLEQNSTKDCEREKGLRAREKKKTTTKNHT